MCWVCDSKSSIAETYWANKLALLAHFSEAKATDGLTFDGVGDKAGEPGLDLVITTDAQPDDTGSTATIEVNGEHVISTLDSIGDQDFFSVQLQAGQTYEIGQYAFIGGPGGVPLADAYIEIYDSAGNLIVSADGGGPNTPSGLDALLSFTPEADGTYFINARAYDQDSTNGTTGDFVGDYELFVDLAPEGTYVYQPYYDVDSPLYALDWGSQVDGSSRNPDGEEGPRPTGNEFTGHAYNPYGIEGKTVITYYFAKQGDVFVSEDPTNPGLTENIVAAGMADWEKNAFTYAFDQFESAADVVFVEVENRNEADFTLITYAGTPGPGASLLGRMSPPDEQNEGQAEFNSADERWTEEGLAPGGFSFVTLIHELGHGMGMAHPHDNGGRSGIMHGVEEESTFNYSTGDFDLNQGVHTMMSYEDGWQTSPYGNAPTDAGYGYLGGLMAFDIAVIQDKYGVNEDTNAGNNVYRLKDVNAAGTFFYSIWDAGGTDKIVYDGARNTTIDLRAATLQYEEGGGGRVSYAFGIFGGFTIANGVTIENASTASGNDTLIGNTADNVMDMGAGDDFARSGSGADEIDGQGGRDILLGGGGHDLLAGGAGNDRMEGDIGNDTYWVHDVGDQIVELADEGHDRVFARTDFTLSGHLEELHLRDAAQFGTGNALDNLIVGSDGNNRLFGLDGADVMRGGSGDDTLGGGANTDSLVGDAGNDVLRGDAGRDTLNGGAGADVFAFNDDETSSARSSADVIIDFSRGEGDLIDLSAVDSNAATGTDDSFTFIGDSAFSGTAGELRYRVVDGDGFVEGDLNGDGTADLVIRVDNASALTVSDFVL